ncbi:dynamin family protein [Nakamurella sp. A5-74]|uniref:Dynamin family protein n=1 Tax=Nakamurella sp. A5-74 TaxID=3158264 RepID=A0AAU8DTL1_9ACTN
MTSPPPALPQAIRQWREQAVAWVRPRDAETAAVLASARRPAGIPRVVVVGETNRGKSSLVNALLGVPNLSPVDAGLATSTYLQISRAADGAPPARAIAHFGPGMADISFPIAELHGWATMGASVEADRDLPPPRWIELAVPSALLDAVVLLDTPGVGGLVPGHADLAAEAAAGATALLFVVDASAPFSQGEIGFLQSVTDRVDAVHFVVTKTDSYRGWREIVAADQQLLARYVPRFTDAPFHPVSSTLAVAADAQPDARIAQVVRAQSGIEELRSVLTQEVSGRAALLADANLIRTAVTVLAGELVRLETERRTLTSGAEQVEHLRLRKEELLERRRTGGGRSWQVILRAQIQRARVDLTHETAREVREALNLFRGAIDAADADQLRQLPFHIDAYAQSMTARAHRRLLEAMNQIVNSVLADLFTPTELATLAGHLATRPYEPLVTRGPERTKNADDTIMSFAGGGIGLTLGSLVRMGAGAVLPAAFGVVLLPVSLALGGAAAFFMVRSRRRVQDKAHLKQWLMEVLSEAKAQIDQNIAEQFIEADEQLTLALDDVLTKQVSAIDTEIRDVDSALKLDATERAARTRALVDRGKSGATLVGAGEELIRRVQRTPGVGAVMLGAGALGAVGTQPVPQPAAGPNPGVRTSPRSSAPPEPDPAVTQPTPIRSTPAPVRPVPGSMPRAPFPTGPTVTRTPIIPTGSTLAAIAGRGRSRPDADPSAPSSPVQTGPVAERDVDRTGRIPEVAADDSPTGPRSLWVPPGP